MCCYIPLAVICTCVCAREFIMRTATLLRAVEKSPISRICWGILIHIYIYIRICGYVGICICSHAIICSYCGRCGIHAAQGRLVSSLVSVVPMTNYLMLEACLELYRPAAAFRWRENDHRASAPNVVGSKQYI